MRIEKIYFINLESRKDRCAFINSYLGKFDIEFERFEGIRPTISSLIDRGGEYHEFYLRATERFRSYANNRKLYPRAIGVFGCYISHYLIHEKALSEGHGDYVILEDDCRIAPNSFDRVEQALATGDIGKDWDIIRDCCHSNDKVCKFTSSHQESFHSTHESSHRVFGGSRFSIFKGSSSKQLLDYLRSDRLLAIDAAYSTHMMNVYHGSFGVTIENLGTDIPKIDDTKWYLLALQRLKEKFRLGIF